jgi:hypothetical protein
MSDTQLNDQLSNQPPDTKTEVLRINNQARDKSLQIALLVPVIAGLIGIFNSFRMMKLPDIKPSADLEGAVLG